NLIDGHDLTRLRAGEELAVVIAPPRGDARAERPSLILRVAGRPRHDVEDANLEHVAGLRVFYRHGAGADVHAEPLARAAAEHRRVHRAGPAPIHALPIPAPGQPVFRHRL